MLGILRHVLLTWLTFYINFLLYSISFHYILFHGIPCNSMHSVPYMNSTSNSSQCANFNCHRHHHHHPTSNKIFKIILELPLLMVTALWSIVLLHRIALLKLSTCHGPHGTFTYPLNLCNKVYATKMSCSNSTI